jgi:serine/threonine-protein kinase
VDQNDRLVDVAIHIADGAPIDWSAVASSATSGEAEVVAYLRALERIAQVHSSGSIAGSSYESVIGATSLPVDHTHAPVAWGPLTIIEKVGRGTYGDVYRARDPRLDRPVALKLLRRRERGAEALESAVIEEGRLMARVRHPNVVTVYGAERIEGRVGLWMEFVGTGRTLEDELRARGPFPAADVAAVGRDLAAALGAVHRAGLLHRDVKAQNAMRDAEGRIVLTDFGAGHQVEEDSGALDHGLAGTPLYLAPEVLNGAPASVASDLYSLGVVLFHIATASFPVRGRTMTEIRRAHDSGQRRGVAPERPDLPSWLADVIDTLIESNPRARFTTAADVEAALAGPEAARRVQPLVAQGVRHRWLGLAAAAAVVILTTALAVGAWRARSEAGVSPAPTPWVPLNAGDWIMVADFDNRTGEEIFDGTIEAALKRELEYSDFLRVAQRVRVVDALLSMSRPLDARLDRQLARDVSLRDGGFRAFVAGSIAKAGPEYEVVSEIVDPASGATVARLTDRAPGQSEVLAAVRRHTLKLRAQLGEPDGSIARSREALKQAPVPRVKALHLLTRALAMAPNNPTPSLNSWENPKPDIGRLYRAEQMLREAVDEDPTFAAAALWFALFNLRIQGPPGPHAIQGDRGANIMRYTQRASELAATATPLERLRITGHFHHSRTGTPEDPEKVAKAAAAWEALSASQPDDETMQLLQNCYRVLGRMRDAAALDLRIAEARPRNVAVNFRVANRLLNESNFDGTRRYVLRAQAALSPSMAAADPQRAVWLRIFPVLAAWRKDDARDALRLTDEIMAAASQLSPAEQREVYVRLWPIYVALGRISQAGQTIEGLRAMKGSDVEDQWVEVNRASFFDVIGDRRQLREVVASWPDPLPADAPRQGELAFFIAAGRLEAAERELRFSERALKGVGAPGQIINLNFAGALELARGHHAAAIDLMQHSMRMMRVAAADAGWSLSGHGQWAAPKLAEALEQTHRLREAIAILEEAGQRRSEVAAFGMNRIDWWMRHRAQLARLYRKNGQLREAEAVEAHLRTLLAVADPDYPMLKELNTRAAGAASVK